MNFYVSARPPTRAVSAPPPLPLRGTAATTDGSAASSSTADRHQAWKISCPFDETTSCLDSARRTRWLISATSASHSSTLAVSSPILSLTPGRGVVLPASSALPRPIDLDPDPPRELLPRAKPGENVLPIPHLKRPGAVLLLLLILVIPLGFSLAPANPEVCVLFWSRPPWELLALLPSRRSAKQRSWRAPTTSGQALRPLVAWSPAKGMWEVRLEFFVLERGTCARSVEVGCVTRQDATTFYTHRLANFVDQICTS